MLGFGFQDQVAAINSKIPTVDELLQRQRIELNKTSLVSALKNNSPEVRRLAAQKPAELEASDTIPDIIAALRSETVPRPE